MSPKVATQPATRSTSGPPSMTGAATRLPARAYRLTGVMPLIVTIAGMTPVVDPSAFVAPTAAVLGNAEIDARASIFHGASVRADSAAIRIGRETNVQDNAVLHADPDAPCTVGDRVTIGHGAVVHGCIIEDDCLIGMNATVLNHAVVGTGSLVAAGSVVLQGMHIPPRSLVAGVPAKVRRTISDEEVESIRQSAATYIRLAEIHRRALADTP